MCNDQQAASPPIPRVILLGASNLSRAISMVVGTTQAILGSPLELHIAMGHGRSFGRASRVLGRTLPGIDECGLWEALSGTGDVPTYALITDIGNDIIYGYDIELIAEWIERCLARLNALGAQTILTRIPIQSIESLSPLRYRVAKAVLFPGRRLSLKDATSRIHELDTLMHDLADQYGATLVDLPGRWYGFDPIHIKRSLYQRAFAELLASWSDNDGPGSTAHGSLGRWLRLRLARPQRWGLLGIPLGTTQAAVHLSDGSRVALY